jgi:hypothetical protein
MSVHEEIREQRKKLKGQGFKAHWDYFWEYYKIHTIVALIAIIFIVTFARDMLNNKPYALYSMLINAAGLETQEKIQNGYAEYAGIDTTQEAILADTSAGFSLANMDNSTVATSEKLMAVMASNELDVIVADTNTFGHYASLETYMDLRDVYSADEIASWDSQGLIFYVDQGYIDYLTSSTYTDYLTNGQYDKSNKYAVMAAKYNETFEYPVQDKSEMDNPVPVGIILKNSKILTDCGAYPNEAPIVGIIINTERIDNAKKFLAYLMQ